MPSGPARGPRRPPCRAARQWRMWIVNDKIRVGIWVPFGRPEPIFERDGVPTSKFEVKGRRRCPARSSSVREPRGACLLSLHVAPKPRFSRLTDGCALECGVGFRQLRTCRRTRPGQLWANRRRTALQKKIPHEPFARIHSSRTKTKCAVRMIATPISKTCQVVRER